jgi:hypothetical protein
MRTTHNAFINLTRTRSLYNRNKLRKEYMAFQRINVLMNRDTYDMVALTVPVGKGLYGSAFIEFCVRLVTVLLSSGEDLEYMAEEVKQIVLSPYFISNMERLIKILDRRDYYVKQNTDGFD